MALRDGNSNDRLSTTQEPLSQVADFLQNGSPIPGWKAVAGEQLRVMQSTVTRRNPLLGWEPLP